MKITGSYPCYSQCVVRTLTTAASLKILLKMQDSELFSKPPSSKPAFSKLTVACMHMEVWGNSGLGHWNTFKASWVKEKQETKELMYAECLLVSDECFMWVKELVSISTVKGIRKYAIFLWFGRSTARPFKGKYTLFDSAHFSISHQVTTKCT